jgi:hypothetical protein
LAPDDNVEKRFLSSLALRLDTLEQGTLTEGGRYNTQHNDILHNDTQHNDVQHKDTQHNDIQHNDTQHNI